MIAAFSPSIPRSSVRRSARVLLLALLIGQAASNAIEAVLLILDVVKYTKEPHEVIMTSWMIMTLLSLGVLEAALVWLLLGRH